MPAPKGHSNIFEVEPPAIAAWKVDPVKKREFGIELAKNPKPFEAACELFEDSSQAMWVSINWLTDPVVLASRDAYRDTSKINLLDKEALAHKLLQFAEEKDPSNRFYTCDHKDRYNYLKLYAEIQGYIGKVDINASTNNFTNNTMKIVFVKPDNQNDKPIIDASSEEKQDEVKKLPLNIKLVSAR